MALGTRHRFAPLKRAFYYQKGASKRLNGAHITAVRKQIKALWWFDPNRDDRIRAGAAQYAVLLFQRK